MSIEPRTGRQLGDHGTAEQAIRFALEGNDPDMPLQERDFLEAWSQGSLDEWPGYYEWLAYQESRSERPAVPDVEQVEAAAMAIVKEIGWGSFSHFDPEDVRRIARAALASQLSNEEGEGA